jgi:hypothetical protein
LDPAFRNSHFRSQADYRVDGARILHFEDGVLSCINEIGAAIGLPEFKTLPHERRSKNYMAEPSSRDIELIHEAFAADYEMFPHYRSVREYSKPAPSHGWFVPRMMPR